MAEYEEAGYYEIQLNNKQLVFFFMAAVAIAVVVFLFGGMAGRRSVAEIRSRPGRRKTRAGFSAEAGGGRGGVTARGPGEQPGEVGGFGDEIHQTERRRPARCGEPPDSRGGRARPELAV